MDSLKILACNAGSTSLKFRFYEMPEEKELLAGKIEKIGSANAIVSYECRNIKKRFVQSVSDFREGIELFLSVLFSQKIVQKIEEIEGVAFKTVHGGNIMEPCIIDEYVLNVMDEYQTAAPLHNRVYSEVIRVFQKMLPSCILVAVFETTFHKYMPEYIRRYSVPYDWKERYGIQKYGFHGASHGYISKQIRKIMQLEEKDNLNLISCHLGGSSSICLIKNGVSMGATQGFSPQSGIAMGTRVGDLDIYVLFYLVKKGFTLEQLNDILFNQSGLKGISGIGDDIRELEEAVSKGDIHAALALDVYCYDVKRYIGQSLAVLGKTDVIVMTGGIGQNSVHIRKRILSNLEHLGILLDDARNEKNIPESEISADNSPIKVYVVPTNEEIMITREAYKVIIKQ